MDDNEIKRRLTGRAAEYMMFKDDEEDTEAPVDITSTGNVIVFPDFEKLKSEVEKCVQSCQCFCWSVTSFNSLSVRILRQNIC